MATTVKINITEATGEVTIEVGGVVGKKCLDITRQIEEAIGTTTKSVATADMHAHKPTQVNQHQNRR